jgi:hypothetical protein
MMNERLSKIILINHIKHILFKGTIIMYEIFYLAEVLHGKLLLM